jgi:hypothetical protein
MEDIGLGAIASLYRFKAHAEAIRGMLPSHRRRRRGPVFDLGHRYLPAAGPSEEEEGRWLPDCAQSRKRPGRCAYLPARRATTGAKSSK